MIDLEKVRLIDLSKKLTPGSMAIHDFLLRNDIPIIEGLDNLQALTKQRFFFIECPLKIAVLDLSWTRAVALEIID
jgi:kynurenine formamidase